MCLQNFVFLCEEVYVSETKRTIQLALNVSIKKCVMHKFEITTSVLGRYRSRLFPSRSGFCFFVVILILLNVSQWELESENRKT